MAPNELLARIGGSISSSICSFTEDGAYALCPRGREVSVISSKTGTKIGAVDDMHDACIMSVVRFDLVDQSAGVGTTFASLDSSNTAYIWTLKCVVDDDDNNNNEMDVESCRTPTFRSRIITSFNLTSLELPDVSGLTRQRIESLHPCTGVLKSSDSASLLVVISCRVLTNTTVAQHTTADETEDDEADERPSPSSRPVVEVFEFRLMDLMSQDIAVPARLFVCGLEARRRTLMKDMILASAASLSGEYIAICMGRMFYLWNRITDSLFSAFHKDPLTAVAVHPESKCVATGDAAGRVTWWFVMSKILFTTGAGGSVPDRCWSLTGSDHPRALRAKAQGRILPSRKKLEEIEHFAATGNFVPQTGAAKDVQFTIVIQHWHSHPVCAVAFHGLHLISAGQEGVLVFWNTTQADRHFVPRLKAPVIRLACSEQTVIACLSDNSIAIVDATLYHVRAEYRSIQLPLSLLPGFSGRSGAVRAKKTDILPVSIIPFGANATPAPAIFVGSGVTFDGLGPNSVVQIYDVLQDTSLGTFNVSQQNFVSRDRAKRYQWTVQQVATNGRQLATVEFRRSMLPPCIDYLTTGPVTCAPPPSVISQRELSPPSNRRADSSSSAEVGDGDCPKRRKEVDMCERVRGEFSDRERESGKYYLLKFWQLKIREDGIKKVDLIASIDSPHLHDVTSLTPINREDKPGLCDFISTSLDGSWKFWRYHENSSIYSCAYCGTNRSLPCLAAGLSQDNSLLAISHPRCVSVWDRTTFRLISCVPAPRDSSRLSRVCWLEVSRQADTANKVLNGEMLLLTASGGSVWIWDLKQIKPELAWCLKSEDPDIAMVLQPDVTGGPRFGLLSPATQTLIIREVERNLDGKINCDVVRTLCGGSGTTSLLGFSFFGTAATGPVAAFFDSSLELRLFSVATSSDNTNIQEIQSLKTKRQSLKTAGSTDVKSSLISDDKQISSRISSTNFLSSYIMRNRPALQHLLNDPKQIQLVTEQSVDGLSHLAPAPSAIYRNFLSLNNNRLTTSAPLLQIP